MFAMHVHCFVVQESGVIKVLALSCVEVDFKLCLFEIFVSLWVFVFWGSFESSKDVLCVEVVKTPNDENRAARPKPSNNNSLPYSINIILLSNNICKKQCLSPKYEYTNAPCQRIKRHSGLQKINIILLSVPPRAKNPVE